MHQQLKNKDYIVMKYGKEIKTKFPTNHFLIKQYKKKNQSYLGKQKQT